ncbi:MAG TPA: hypothetical protein VGK46_13820 [Saprospiraceae bacterium]
MKAVTNEQIGINSMYASNFLHNALWIWVNAQKVAGVERIQAIRSFMQFFNVGSLDENTLCQVYYRKNDEYKKCAASIACDAKNVFQESEKERFWRMIKEFLNENDGP